MSTRPGTKKIDHDAPAILAMLSGGGRTLLNLLDRIDDGSLPARIPMAIASRDCAGVERARARGVETRVITGEIPADRLAALCNEAGASWIVLCGYLRRVHLPAHMRGKCVNIHPALLPAFGGQGMYGDRVHEAVAKTAADPDPAKRITETGCTVHLVDDEYDRGPVVLQRRCPVAPGDTPDQISVRVFELETEAYPEALRSLLDNDL
ncbi:MAG: formyltransferase family protein [Planctomycetota bacterium]